MLSSSATPTQKSLHNQQPTSYGTNNGRTSFDRDALQPVASGMGPRSNSAMSFAPRGSSLNPSPAPGSFSSNLRSQLAPSRTGSSQDVNVNVSVVNLERLDEDDGAVPGQVLAALRESLNREMKIKEGSENMLEALNTKKAKQTKEQRLRVEAELNSSNQKIRALKNEISELQRPKQPLTPTRSRMDTLFQSNGLRSPPSAARSAGSDYDEPQESPTYALAEILQALEIEGLTPDYYVGHANNLVELFKRYPTLKYDLVWSVFGLRMQVMLLSESREVVAAGYRMTRYAISDISSLQKIRTLNTDYLVVLSLIKKSNADVEREQALKFVRAFVDVKDGIQEVSRAVVRTIASVAEHAEDRLRSICIETLGEMMIRDPGLLVISGGIRPLADALGEGTYEASESLTAAFLFLMDAPQRRKYLRAGYELEDKIPILGDFIFGWTASDYLRACCYSKISDVKPGQPVEEETGDKNFVDHYTALLLAVLITSDMLPGLLQVTRDADNSMLKRKTTLLIGEVLKLASRLLPSNWSSDLQLLPDLFAAASHFGDEERFDATGTVYQISSVSRTLYRTAPNVTGALVGVANNSHDNLTSLEDQPKINPNVSIDENTFRQLLVETQVLSSTNPIKWKWDIVLKIIEGPLLNGKRLDEAIKASKFIKRIMSFYRPFKYKFAEIRYTRINQKYIKVGCALIHTLLQTTEGVKYLADNKLLRQIAECLAQCDPTSGLTAQSPMFSKERLSETLCSGYFAMLGTMSGDPKGLQMLDRWRMINMMYHIIGQKQRPDLIKLLLSNFDYSLQGHPRVLLSKALTAGSKEIRIHATNVLRKYSKSSRPTQSVGDSKWAIQLLVTQLYDPEVEVCATAIKILEEACNRKNYLEYVVQCRPALDHLGEIGAPLLLRFLSTSIGYHYLDGLDYISNEMDDWFLGRNDSYVGVIEASLARAFVEMPEETSNRMSIDEDTFELDADNDGHVPPHFYRELTRTKEGCKLLRDKGHFEEFASTIRDYGMLSDDPEIILKVKGCLWAVGNVGSMELGAPFLEESDVVENIVRIAESHEVMSLRGTAFFVLGLISRSVHGLEIMSEFGWDSNTTTMGASLGLCIPQNLNKFFSYQTWSHEKASEITASREQRAAIMAAKTDDDFVSNRILELVIDLGNTVLQKRAMTELMHIKSKKLPNFNHPALFRKVMTLLESSHFRINVRRFVIELFERSVLRRIVFEEESDDEDMDSDDDSSSEGRTERQRSISEL
ncbi:Target of rapamycin complex 2 subunit [Lachnellula hyalina]|uniref:Target of rapamycin complex 2 subunit n=1 Tax=Lachnellula hyalina TaxID=1316788 RepID=A0A8H8R5K6_9HELO|nr:Target of rapamycin complex 2 subunit [Lachnellula hyalina]TVY29027.1 Target of rapamycin complex 2 subunit [Lachnellula hyalina]